jgi:hypothetical protein
VVLLWHWLIVTVARQSRASLDKSSNKSRRVGCCITRAVLSSSTISCDCPQEFGKRGTALHCGADILAVFSSLCCSGRRRTFHDLCDVLRESSDAEASELIASLHFRSDELGRDVETRRAMLSEFWASRCGVVDFQPQGVAAQQSSKYQGVLAILQGKTIPLVSRFVVATPVISNPTK